MIELNNQSNWSAGLFPGWSQQGNKQFTLVVKQVYEYNNAGKVTLMQQTPELVMADEYVGEPGQSTVIKPSEIVPFKYGSEVIVTGKAFPPVAQPPLVMEATVGLQFPNGKPWSKSIMVIGERHWQSSLLGTVASDPSHLKPIELIYEYAFGGKSVNNEQQSFPENPAGVGFDLGRNAKGQPLPQLETPGQLIRKASQQVSPAGFAAIASNWSPRIERTPEIDDDALVAGEYPFKEPLDPRYYNQAPADQQFRQPFSGHLVVTLRGMTDKLDYRKVLTLKLPCRAPITSAQNSSGQDDAVQQHLTLNCDTLIIDTEAQTLTQLWRAQIPAASITQKIWITVAEPEVAPNAEADEIVSDRDKPVPSQQNERVNYG